VDQLDPAEKHCGDVREAAAIAVPHSKCVARPLVLVVPRDGHTVDPASVLALHRGKEEVVDPGPCDGSG